MTKRVTGKVTRRVTTRRVKITWRVYKERYLAGYCSGKHSYKKKHDALVQCYKRKGNLTNIILVFFTCTKFDIFCSRSLKIFGWIRNPHNISYHN